MLNCPLCGGQWTSVVESLGDLCAGATPSACHELEGEEESPDAAAADEAAARLALALDGEISRALGAKPPRG
jgi:hypothetical protein